MNRIWFCRNCNFKFKEPSHSKHENREICPYCGSKQIHQTDDIDNYYPYMDTIR